MRADGCRFSPSVWEQQTGESRGNSSPKISSPKAICRAWEKSLTHPKEFSKSFRLETIAPNYKRTNHEFRDRLRKNWNAAVSLVGEETVRRFDKYFRVSAAGFSRGTTNLYRITFRRLAHPRFDIAL